MLHLTNFIVLSFGFTLSMHYYQYHKKNNYITKAISPLLAII